MRQSTRRTHIVTAALVACGVVPIALSASPVAAIAGTITTDQLALECATKPGNVVTLLDSVIVESLPGVTTVAATGCTINIPSSRSIEFVGADISFAGPLSINGSPQTKAEVKLDSRVRAASVAFRFSGLGGQVLVQDSQVGSNVGGVSIALGGGATALVSGTSLFGSTIDAAGPLSMTTGAQAFVSLNSTTVTAAGVNVALGGTDSVALIESSTVATTGPAQSIAITSSAAKAKVDLIGSTLTASGNLSVRLAGTESAIFAANSQAVAAGSVALTASPTTGKGLVEWGGSESVLRGSSVVVEASTASTFGSAKVAGGIVSATPGTNVVVRTGALGTTEVLESAISAGSAVRITSAATGACKQESNVITAPIQQLCR